MIRLIAVELLKLRTTRLTYGLLATAVGLTATFAVIEAARAGSGSGPAPLSTASGLNDVITAGIWAVPGPALVMTTSAQCSHSDMLSTKPSTRSRPSARAASRPAGQGHRNPRRRRPARPGNAPR
jgi:hypothetical protein